MTRLKTKEIQPCVSELQNGDAVKTLYSGKAAFADEIGIDEAVVKALRGKFKNVKCSGGFDIVIIEDTPPEKILLFNSGQIVIRRCGSRELVEERFRKLEALLSHQK